MSPTLCITGRAVDLQPTVWFWFTYKSRCGGSVRLNDEQQLKLWRVEVIVRQYWQSVVFVKCKNAPLNYFERVRTKWGKENNMRTIRRWCPLISTLAPVSPCRTQGWLWKVIRRLPGWSQVSLWHVTGKWIDASSWKPTKGCVVYVHIQLCMFKGVRQQSEPLFQESIFIKKDKTEELI